MSRRVITKIDVKDKALATQALKLAGYEYRDQGENLFVTSGPFKNAVINLKSGEISGDSDYSHTQEALGKFRQNYAEAKYRAEIQLQGGIVESRQVQGEDIVLFCAVG